MLNNVLIMMTHSIIFNHFTLLLLCLNFIPFANGAEGKMCHVSNRRCFFNKTLGMKGHLEGSRLDIKKSSCKGRRLMVYVVSFILKEATCRQALKRKRR